MRETVNCLRNTSRIVTRYVIVGGSIVILVSCSLGKHVIGSVLELFGCVGDNVAMLYHLAIVLGYGSFVFGAWIVFLWLVKMARADTLSFDASTGRLTLKRKDQPVWVRKVDALTKIDAFGDVSTIRLNSGPPVKIKQADYRDDPSRLIDTVREFVSLQRTASATDKSISCSTIPMPKSNSEVEDN